MFEPDTSAARARSVLPGNDLIPGDQFSLFDPRFPTPLAALIAGAEPATVRSWGRKYRLNKWTTHENRNAGIMWSVLDLLFLRLMAVMVSKGIDPGDAAWRIGANGAPKDLALGLVMMFAGLITDSAAPSLLVFHAGPTEKFPNDKVSFHLIKPDEPIGQVFERLKKKTVRWEFVLLDVRDVIKAVELCLGINIFEGRLK